MTATTLAIRIDMPPTGELETTGDGKSPTQAQMDEEFQARQKFIDTVSPLFKAAAGRLLRTGVVSQIELLGHEEWGQLNHYLVLVRVAAGGTGIPGAISELLPPDAQVSVVNLTTLQDWPEPDPA